MRYDEGNPFNHASGMYVQARLFARWEGLWFCGEDGIKGKIITVED